MTDDAEEESELDAEELAAESDGAVEDSPNGDGTDDSTVDEEALESGDFVEIEYSAFTVDDEQLVDTTDEEVAEREDLDTESMEFGPRTIVLGEGHLFEPVEDDIVGGAVGESGSVVVPAAEAFGEYDADAVETISADKIEEDDRYPGAHVHVDGRHGYINTIIGGRARVDFNHPLAGEDIEYEYSVVDRVEDREAQAGGLFKMVLDVEPDLWIEAETREVPPEDEEDEATTEEVETLYVEASPALTMNQQWMFAKQQVAQQVIESVGVDRVIVQEVLEGGGGMPGMPGMAGGGATDADIESALEDADVDASEIVEELEEP